MSMDALSQPFQATVESSLDGLRGLLDLLHEEQTALTQANADAIEAISQRKLAQLQALEHSVMAREQIQQQAGCASGLNGGRQFIQQHFKPEQILKAWQTLEQLSQQVQQLNTANARLATNGENQARQALNILTGRESETNTYSKKQRAASAGYTLGKC